jgi:V-type H+-transporting ATPase subunit C
VFFVIGVSKIGGNATASVERVNTSIGSNGKLYNMNIDGARFKLGNFDNMMLNYENVQKIESTVEGLLKRIQKAYLDVEPKADLQKMMVESKENGNVDPETFVLKFKWDDSKYPRNQQLVDLLKIITQRITTVDNNLKNKLQAYVDTKNSSMNISKKETGSIFNRNLNELFVSSKAIKPSDFVNTPQLQTMIAIVPEKEVGKWNSTYESLNDYIVPKSSKEIPVGSEVGPYKLFRFVFLRKMAEDVVNEARNKYKWTIREFTYDTEEIMKKEEQRQKLATQATSDIDNLKKTCTESFKDIYSTFIHLKFLKVIIDSQMRFGSPDDYLVLLVAVNKGKDKRIHSGIIDVFAEKSKKEFYGTKEDLNDSEDFFPYAFALIDLP